MEKDNYIYENINEAEEDEEFLRNQINNLEKDENNDNSSALSKIEDDISAIKKSIEVTDKRNIRNRRIKNLKIFGRALQGVYPYILVTGALLFIHVGVCGDVPFYRQDEFHVAQHEEVIDVNGLIYDNVSYVDPSANVENTAYYSSAWEKKEDGKYYRTIKKYNVGKYSIDELKEVVNNPDLKFDDVFGEVTKVEFQVKKEDQITENDLKEGMGFKIVYRYKDDEDIILSAQDIGPNFSYSCLYIFFILISNMLIPLCRVETKSYNFRKHLEEIRRRYPNMDLSEIKRLFEENKIKFERIKHQYVTLEDPKTKEVFKIKTKLSRS